jgi:hypothetical protein
MQPLTLEPPVARQRRTRRRRWVLLVAVVVVVLAVGGLFVARAVSGPSVTPGTVAAPNLPWPSDGQAAVEV